MEKKTLAEITKNGKNVAEKQVDKHSTQRMFLDIMRRTNAHRQTRRKTTIMFLLNTSVCSFICECVTGIKVHVPIVQTTVELLRGDSTVRLRKILEYFLTVHYKYSI